ncbi:MAG: carbon storage regulator CsrA [Caldicoprobacterales bacterium]|jgi:carbon storage regulator|nr:carbon storage regulator CsrA [Clostridiales bacterium]
MLVLTRRKDESIMIDNSIEIVVLGIEGDRVRIGIEAPKDVTILRKEVYLDVAASNRQALSSALPKDLPLSNIFPQED